MTKLIFRIALMLNVALALSSCTATHSGYMQSSAALSSANFSYVTNVRGESSATYVFGIGGLNKETLVDDAQKRMILSNPLKKNQAIANLTVNFKKTYIYFGVITTVKCVVTADIVEFEE
jgi:hypothetical protein